MDTSRYQSAKGVDYCGQDRRDPDSVFDSVRIVGWRRNQGLDVVVGAHHFQVFILLMPGQKRRTALHIEEAKSLAISTGHIQTICTTLAQRTLWHRLVYGDRSDAERCLNKLLSIAQEHNLTHRIVAMNNPTGSLT